MEKFEGVANTLFIPLAARIAISKQYPEYFYDHKALQLEKYLPDDANKGSFEYTNMASIARYYNMDRVAIHFIEDHNSCNIVYLGAGLDTAYDRITEKIGLRNTNYYECDLEEVIEARRKVFGKRKQETTIAGNLFQMEWIDHMDTTLPTLIIVSGVFQYFHNEETIAFIKKCKAIFNQGEFMFDATSESGLKFTNWFIKRTGNKEALMYGYVNDSKDFAKQVNCELIEEILFFGDTLDKLGKKLNLISRISMKSANKKKQTIILHLKLN